MGTGSFLVV